MKPVTIGTVGSGYAAALHGNGYQKISRIPVRLKTVCDIVEEKAKEVQEAYHYEGICTDFETL